MPSKITSDHAIICSDGIKLSAALFEPEGLAKAAIMIAPATGIRKTFYFSLANFLVEHNYAVICFENRGIGQSHMGDINDVDASLINWGRLDMTAVLNEMKERFPENSYHLIGHSAGGQLLGLMDHAHEIKSMFNFACSSGYIGNIPYPYKISGSFFLRVFLPMSAFFMGQANNQWVGMGEPLPGNVARQWSRWCTGPGYVANDFGTTIDTHFYDKIDIPSKWVHATDDPIANLDNVKDMIRVYSQIRAEVHTIDPKEFDYPNLGHMQFFSSKRKKLWKLVLDWMEEHK